ncbi:cytochrome d ubiquinol oxidase subunit II [Corynebacterium diphtheriae]|uniref:cytochrome d ubiquinol oxidase subunit II n=1 Tax=Corynebacterium diphtheriae TaxID=1717 RepID=UPI0013CC0107|nr:cytochrome d ubiquinol oxidase subunit II [Corynebacterium diphtheriae]UJL57670.1 cytochrome d ubiquinol oxidase subunit II [Corynebacterium diphtheriae]CAB0857028.1 cytochrome d ubiquinol oxidase subunit II [Corynebacterium diphtheriae]
MDLQTVWFVLVAVLFAGYFVLEGFDFGVGMLLPFLSKQERTAAIKAIGPVWDGNEVWLITAGGALFAAFPEWYATMFSGFYLPLFLILIGLILRGVALEWRGKVDTNMWRDRCDIGIGIGSWVPALLWGVAFANVVHGVAIDSSFHIDSSLAGLIALLNPFGLLGGVAFVLVFLLHGALFLKLKTEITVMGSLAGRLFIPAAVVGAVFLVWTQLAHGRGWTWAPLVIAVVGLVVAALGIRGNRDGWAFAATSVVILCVAAVLFGSLFPNLMPTTLADGTSLTIYNASSSQYTLTMMTWAAVLVTPLVLLYQGWTYWVFRQRVRV